MGDSRLLGGRARAAPKVYYGLKSRKFGVKCQVTKVGSSHFQVQPCADVTRRRAGQFSSALLIINTCNVDEYFQNTPRTSAMYLHRPLLVLAPQI